MKGQAYINGQDLWTTFRAQLVRGSYEALLTPAPMKDYIGNESRRENGRHVVATAETSRQASRELQLSVFVEGATQAEYLRHYEALLSVLTSGVFTLRVPILGKTYRLVYTGCSKYGNYGLKRGKFVLKLIEPDPTNRANA